MINTDLEKTRLLAKLADASEVQGVSGAFASRQFKLPVEVEDRNVSDDVAVASTSTPNFISCEAGNTGATQQFAAAVELGKKSTVSLEIRDVAFGGAGIGHVNGVACFVKGVIDGEQVLGHVVRKKARFMEADLVEVLRPSPHRVEAPCPYFLKCGGCSYQHLNYAHQLKIKEQQLRESLRRIGGIENPPVYPIIPSPEPFHYRNRITVHVKEGALGFFAEKSREVVEIDRCLLASEEVNQALQQLRSQRPHDGNYLLGEKESYGGFRQVNNVVAELLLNEVVRLAGSGDLLIDAYCGAGFFSHALRHYFQKVIGIERSRGSVSLARRDAEENETFLEGGVEELLPEVLNANVKGVLILDPPSEGLSDLVSAAILKSPPQKIVYVSCNPTTLARDLKRLLPYYHLEQTIPLDMFPQTAEIESVSLLIPKTFVSTNVPLVERS